MKLDLERYNRVVWAILGTLALAGLAASLVAALASLWPSNPHAGTISAQGAAPLQGPAAPASSLRFGFPERLQGTDFLLIPVEAPVEGHRGGGGSGFGSYAKNNEAPLFNLVFLNAKTGATHALLAKKALIIRYEVLDDRRGEGARAVGLVFRVVEADTNQNGRLDEEDEDRMYLCDPTGSGTREITPAGAVCERWEFDAERRTLYLLARPKDQPGGNGPLDLLAAPLDGNQPPQPLLPRERTEALRSILGR